MDGRFNTIAGWVLGGGIVLLGANLVTGEIFKTGRPATMGYPINGVEVESAGAPAEQPIAFYLQTADATRGEAVFRKCVSCHSVDQGGANSTGPNLWATMGNSIAHHPGFSYSSALAGMGGRWDWENMSRWLASPRDFANGTKMTFAGLGNPQERADVMLYMNQHGGTLAIPPPPAPAAGEEAGGNEAAANASSGNEAAPANAAAPDANAAPAGNAAGR